MYFNVGDMIKAGLIGNLPPKNQNEKLYRQLTNRYYNESGSQGRKGLETKALHRGRTGESPDHSDAFALAWAGYSLEDLASKKDSSKPSTQSVNVNVIAQIPAGSFKFDDLFKRNHKPNDSKSFNPYRILRGVDQKSIGSLYTQPASKLRSSFAGLPPCPWRGDAKTCALLTAKLTNEL